MSRARKLVLASSAAVIMCVAGFSWPELQQTVRQTVLPSRPVAARPITVTAATRFAGVVAYNLPQFDQMCGCRPNLAVRDVGVGSLIDNVPPRTMIANGAVPLIELEPFGVTLRSIVAGKEDKWLARQARAISRLPGTALMSFAPEANGRWYTWGYHHETPGEFVAAWRHVVRMFRADHRVRWVWMVNRLFPGGEPIRLIWPGKKYVDIVGIDGYFERPGQSYAELFGPTIQYVRSFAKVPILLTEVAARTYAGKARAMAQLVAGTRRFHALGFIWFDVNKAIGHVKGGIYYDWRMETSSTAVAMFRRYARGTRKT